MSLLLPEKIYTYITTGAGLMLLYNWLFIILSAKKLQEVNVKEQIKYYSGIALLIAGISGTLLDKTNRPGFFISVGIVGIIGIFVFFLKKRWSQDTQAS
jgi:L-asparagine transporter-like permease